MKSAWCLVTLLAALALVACGGGDDGGGGDPASFSDGFETSGDWRTISDADVEIGYEDGGLGIQVKVINRAVWTVAGRKFKDGVVSVKARPVGGPDDNAYGLVVRHVDDQNFYRFEISGDGYFAVQAPRDAFSWEALVDWTASPAIRKGQESNQLKVECQGAAMVFYANDVELTRVEDDRYSEGDVGLIAGTFYESGPHVLFDDFQIELLEE
jgi:hypothetical protein